MEMAPAQSTVQKTKRRPWVKVSRLSAMQRMVSCWAVALDPYGFSPNPEVICPASETQANKTLPGVSLVFFPPPLSSCD